ncbi:MAG: hypothetical protein C4576_29895 [Desulfobacteraceae bacterium]|nr:MAG: hypothetical protein C4576_29895 [Desulfobacteraceae bacterium]
MVDQDELNSAGKCENHCRQIEVPTEEEVVALNAMRAIKQEVRILKDRLRGLSAEQGPQWVSERIALQKSLDRFKMEWNDWEKKRKVAAKRRMVLLGHESPDPEDLVL